MIQGDSALRDSRSLRLAKELSRRLPGSSRAIERVRMRIAGLAPLHHPVVVRGEAGSGRTAVVTALHEIGLTAGGSLARIDCSTWEPSRGLGRAEAVYLDGVERLSVAARAFWADVLNGSARLASPRVPRVLASACAMFGVPDGSGGKCALSEELLRFPIDLPPLRDRREDIGPTADAIVERRAVSVDRRATLSSEARSLLCDCAWRGGVGQLERLLERAVAFTTGPTIEVELVGELIAELEEGLDKIRRYHVQQEREDLIQALRRTGGNVSQAAVVLSRSRGAVYRLMQRHGVTRSSAHDVSGPAR